MSDDFSLRGRSLQSRDAVELLSDKYQLTEMGSSLIPPLKALCLWAETHEEGRNQARRDFDARQRKPT
jgi:DNA-binding HxlR family transcriptional regulator